MPTIQIGGGGRNVPLDPGFPAGQQNSGFGTFPWVESLLMEARGGLNPPLLLRNYPQPTDAGIRNFLTHLQPPKADSRPKARNRRRRRTPHEECGNPPSPGAAGSTETP